MTNTTPYPSSLSQSLAFGLLLAYALVGIVGNLEWSTQPAPNTGFDTDSAIEIIDQIFGDELPHPAGSPQNDIIRERIVTLVEQWGHAVEIHQSQQHIHRDPKKRIVPLENIIFRLSGTESGDPILLCAHYDSKPGTPGISDNGVGVGVLLSIAKKLADEPAPKRDILFLITDGEEYGLLGAERWCAEQPLARKIAIAINLEARGTSGPSLMFETGPQSSWLVNTFAETAKHPRTSSLFYEVYRFLPNDTDFSIFKQHDITGYNFAFIGDIQNYHAPTDNMRNLSRNSLQHHGDNMLGLVRVLQQKDLNSIPQGRAVYFDLFGLYVIRWPEKFSYVFFSLLLLFFISRLRFPSVKSFLQPISILIGVGITVFVGCSLMKFDSRLESRWLDNPLPVQWALWILGGMALTLFTLATKAHQSRLTSPNARASSKKESKKESNETPNTDTRDTTLNPVSLIESQHQDSEKLMSGCYAFGLMLAGLSSFTLTGICYLFLVPLLTGAAISLVPIADRKHESSLVAIAITQAVIWLPMEFLIYDALGFVPLVYAIRLSLSLFWLIPVLAWLTSANLVRVTVFLVIAFISCVLLAIF